RGARPSTGTAGYSIEIVGIAANSPMRVGVGRASGEFVEVELAEQHRAGVGKALPKCAIEIRDELGEDFRARGRANTASVAEVLERDGHSVKRSAPIAGGDFLLGPFCSGARNLARYGDVRANFALGLFDTVEVCRGEFNGRNLFGAQLARK